MKHVLPLLGIVSALVTGGAILAYPFTPDASKHWVLYFGFCAMAATFAIVCLMVSKSMEVLVKFAKQIEARRERVKPVVREDSPRDGEGKT